MSAVRRAGTRAAGWTDPAFGRVAGVVQLVSGLVFPPNRQPSAEAGMRRAMTALRITEPEGLGVAVQSPGEGRDAVLAELTVGETYFFREGAQLDVLRTHVLPGLADVCGPARPLRLWSAGCASGEEPYTLAILLRELGWPHPARILGTDVARPRLDAARRGRYTRWSLRGVSPERVDRWFERRLSHFQLAGEIRDAVDFLPLNLVADEYPSVATGTTEQDVVLCRNVLIYFDMESVARIATRLLAALAPGGWLLLGASDPPLAGLVPCEVVLLPGGVAYRPHSEERAARAPVAATRAGPWWSGTTPPVAALTPAAPADDRVRARPAEAGAPAPGAPARDAPAGADEAQLRVRVSQEPGAVADWTLLVRTIANQGRLRDADVECTRALDRHRSDPELHYLHATLLGAAGAHREAAKAARRALYLDPHFVMAYLQLGDSLATLGDAGRAARAFGNAIDGLAGMGDEQPVPAADGVPASRLRHVATARLRALAVPGSVR